MEGQRHNKPLNPRCFCLVEVAKALGGSFKLVMLARKNCKGDDSTAQGNTKEWGYKQIKKDK